MLHFHWAASRANSLTLDKSSGKLCKNKVQVQNTIDNRTLRDKFYDFVGLGDENIDTIILIGYNNELFDNKVLSREMPNLLYHGVESYIANVEKKLFYFDVCRHLGERIKLGKLYERHFGIQKAQLIEWHDAKGDVEATCEITQLLWNQTEIYDKKTNFYQKYIKQ